MDTSFSTNSVFDKINNLSTQVIAIFTAFMQHTKYFFINNTETTDAIIDVPGNIYLLSNTNTVILNNNLCIIYGNILPSNIDDYAIGSLFILTSTGDLYIKKIISGNPSWCKVQLVN
jgi:hypothetical protein